MITFEDFEKLSGVTVVGSRLICPIVNGKRNVDVGTKHGSSFVLNPTGERIVTDSLKANEGEKEEAARSHNDVATVADETKTFTERFNAKKGKKNGA